MLFTLPPELEEQINIAELALVSVLMGASPDGLMNVDASLDTEDAVLELTQ